MTPRVLVVDDEPALLPLLARYLRSLGLEPQCVPGAEEALATFRTADPAFSYVVSDLTLPNANGEDLARELLAGDRTLRILLMSGYPYSTDRLSEDERQRVAFIQKPFLPPMLREVFENWMKADPVVQDPAESAPADLAGGVQQGLEPLGEVRA